MLDRRRTLLTLGGGTGNPIVDIGNLEAWWDRDGINPTSEVEAAAITSWTDAISGRNLLVSVGTPRLHLNTGLSNAREVRFDNASMMYIAEWAGIDFTPRVDPFTIIVKIGQNIGTDGTLVGKQQNGTTNIQYQLTNYNTSLGQIAHHIGTISTTNGTDTFWARAATGSPLTGDSIIAMTVGTGTTDTIVYYNGVPVAYDVFGNNSSLTVGTQVNDLRLTVGARRNDSDSSAGYTFDGDIAHILIYTKELTPAELNTVQLNLI